jgi:predicted RNase H-like nuclease (RuvC/YqgF family)
LHAFSKNSFNLTGGNMAERIVQVEKEKSQLKRMKSELQLNKENHNVNNLEHKVGKAKEKMHTEASINPSVELEEKDKSVIRLNRSFLDKRKAIKCSLAHIEFTKKTNNRILHKLSK